MSKLPLTLLLVGLVVVACDSTVPLNVRDGDNVAGDGGDGSGATSAQGGVTAGDAGAGAAAVGGTATGGSAMGGSAGDATGGQPLGDAGQANGGSPVDGGGEAGRGSEQPPSNCDIPADGPVVGGARLKARCVTAADGSQILTRGKLYDTELDVDCAYRAAGDGSWRCLPLLVGDQAPNAYSDSSCTDRVIFLDPPPGGCALVPPKYAHTLDPAPYCGYSSGLEHHAHIYPIGALLAQPGQLYQKSGNDCVIAGAPLNKVAYALGPELPASSFVAGTSAVVP